MNINKLAPQLKKIVTAAVETGKFDTASIINNLAPSAIKQSKKLKCINFDPLSRTNAIKPKLVLDNNTKELFLWISHNGGNKINIWRFLNGNFKKFSPVASDGRYSFFDIDIDVEDPAVIGSMIYIENSKVTPLSVCLEIAKKLLSKYPVVARAFHQSNVVQTCATKPIIPNLKLDEIFTKPNIFANQIVNVFNFTTNVQKQEIDHKEVQTQAPQVVPNTESYRNNQRQQVTEQNVQQLNEIVGNRHNQDLRDNDVQEQVVETPPQVVPVQNNTESYRDHQRQQVENQNVQQPQQPQIELHLANPLVNQNNQNNVADQLFNFQPQPQTFRQKIEKYKYLKDAQQFEFVHDMQYGGLDREVHGSMDASQLGLPDEYKDVRDMQYGGLDREVYGSMDASQPGLPDEYEDLF